MERIKKLCAYLDECDSFADVGCDHGYCTRYMLQNNLCRRALVSDVSPKCLQKAEKLLAPYIESGVLRAVCCNGLDGIDKDTEQVLIAGMGGEEIVAILERAFIPRKFVFQPMKNVRKLREYLLSGGAEITHDEVFYSGGKYYFVLKGIREGAPCSYSRAQLAFGKNLHSQVLRQYLKEELEKKRAYFKRSMNGTSRAEIEEEINFISEVLSGETE